MKTTNQDRSIQLQALIALIGPSRKPFVETGRKFDKVFVDGKVRYFVARQDMKNGAVKTGDIYGAKSILAPNYRWRFGNLANVEKWNWEGFHGRNVSDTTMMEVKKYGTYAHYVPVPEVAAK